MLNTANFTWKDNKLYLGTKRTGFSIQEGGHWRNQGKACMFRIKYPDGVLSEDYYNLTWAKEHCIAEATQHYNTRVLVPPEPTGEFK